MESPLDHETGTSHGEGDPKIRVFCPWIGLKLNLSLFPTKLFSAQVDEVTSLKVREIMLQRTSLNDGSNVVVAHKNEKYRNRDKQGVNSAHLLEGPFLGFQIEDGFFARPT